MCCSWAGRFVFLLVFLSQLFTASFARNEEYCFTDESSPPDLADCWSLLNDFAHPSDTTDRFFIEEQLREGGGIWSGLHRSPQELEAAFQLPRVFSRRTCNIMLTSYASGLEEVNTLSKTNMAIINQRGNFLLNMCMSKGHPAAGVVTVKSTVMSRWPNALTMWIWGTDSHWDVVFNGYMNMPGPMIVAPMGALFRNLTAASNNGTGISLEGIIGNGTSQVEDDTYKYSSEALPSQRPTGSINPS